MIMLMIISCLRELLLVNSMENFGECLPAIRLSDFKFMKLLLVDQISMKMAILYFVTEICSIWIFSQLVGNLITLAMLKDGQVCLYLY